MQRLAAVQLRNKIMNARTAEHAGTLQLKIFLIGLIDMWHHPKYYKELRKRNKAARIPPTSSGQAASDQAISSKNRDGECERATGPGLKLEATSDKQQASSPNLRKFQATSSKRQA